MYKKQSLISMATQILQNSPRKIPNPSHQTPTPTKILHISTKYVSNIKPLTSEQNRGHISTIDQLWQSSDKKQKRKVNKKNKKKRVRALNEAIDELKSLVERIFYEQQEFEQLKGEFLQVFERIKQRQLFICKIGQFIKQYAQQTVDHICNQINKIFSTIEQQKQKNNKIQLNFQLDSPQFYMILIHKISQQLELIKIISIQTEKIIQYYDRFHKNIYSKYQNNSQQIYQRVANYMICLDNNLRDWIKISTKHFNQNTNFKSYDTLDKLNEILRVMMQPVQDILINTYQKYQNSTQQSESKKPKRKRKMKLQQQFNEIKISELQQIKCMCTNQQDHILLLMQKMQNFTVSQDRIQINISQEDLMKFQKSEKIKKNKK